MTWRTIAFPAANSQSTAGRAVRRPVHGLSHLFSSRFKTLRAERGEQDAAAGGSAASSTGVRHVTRPPRSESGSRTRRSKQRAAAEDRPGPARSGQARLDPHGDGARAPPAGGAVLARPRPAPGQAPPPVARRVRRPLRRLGRRSQPRRRLCGAPRPRGGGTGWRAAQHPPVRHRGADGARLRHTAQHLPARPDPAPRRRGQGAPAPRAGRRGRGRARTG